MSDNYIIDPHRGPHIRDYSDQSQDRVVIASGFGYWAENGCGYTTHQNAGVYTRDDAYKRAGHCGPEKGCCFYDVPADHVPTLQAEVERLNEVVQSLLQEEISVDALRRDWADAKALAKHYLGSENIHHHKPAHAIRHIWGRLVEVEAEAERLREALRVVIRNTHAHRDLSFADTCWHEASAALAAHPRKKEGE